MKHIERTSYLDKLKKLNNTPDIKVVTGVRRSGKSVLMQDYIEYILTNEPGVNVIMINLQDLEYDNLLDYHALHEYVLSKYIKNVHNLVFIDASKKRKLRSYCIKICLKVLHTSIHVCTQNKHLTRDK